MEKAVKATKLNKSECEAFATQIRNTIIKLVDKQYEELLNSSKVIKAIKGIEQNDDYKELYKLETQRTETLKAIVPILKRNNLKNNYDLNYTLCEEYKKVKTAELLKNMKIEKIFPYTSSSNIDRYVTLSLFTNLDIPKFEEIANNIFNGTIEINKY